MTDDIASLRRILRSARTLAVVGLSAEWHRPSFFAAKYMQEHGYRIIPVNPRYPEILGERCYPSLAAIPEPVDLVDVFRRPEHCVDVAREAVEIGAGALWLQLGIRSAGARAIAEAAGLDYVEDACTAVVHRRI